MSWKPSDRSDHERDDSSRERDDGSIGPSTRGSSQSDDFSVRRARDRYGDDYTVGELRRIHRLEQSYGSHIKDWAEEGMPVRAMTDRDAREAFRLQKGTPIPEDIDIFNRKSELRNVEYLNRLRRLGPAGETRVSDTIRAVISSPGRALADPVRRTMEAELDESFADVRIHAGPKAAEAAEQVDARAFTVGNHIVFGHGEYDPESVEGQHVLAHELAHVRQQTGGAVSLFTDAGPEAPPTESTVVQRTITVEHGPVPGVSSHVHREETSLTVHLQRWRDQPRDDAGQFAAKDTTQYDDKKYSIDHRPPYADGQVEAVWQQAKEEGIEDTVEDPNTGRRLTWDRSKSRKGQWDMGHKPQREYRYLLEYYLVGVIGEREFVEEYQNPDHYRPEAPSVNRSQNFEGNGRYWENMWGEIEEDTND